MKNTFYFLAIIAVALVATNAKAQSVYALQNGSKSFFSDKMSDIMSKLQNGDTLYLPGMPVNGDYTFNKKVCIIGAGYHPDSSSVSGISKITGNLIFAPGSDGSSVTGVRVEGRTYFRDSLLSASRCSFGDVEIQNGSNPLTQELFYDCVIRGSVFGVNDVVSNTLFERCLIFGNIDGGNKNNMVIKNCTMLYSGSSFLSGISNLIIKNSVLVNNNSYLLYYSASLTFKNNLFVHAEFSNPSFVMANNVFGTTLANIFIDMDKGDYRIKPTCTQALTLASDGKEVGIYGTEYPFLVPTYAPRYIKINNGESLVNGKLSVQMKVEARDR